MCNNMACLTIDANERRDLFGYSTVLRTTEVATEPAMDLLISKLIPTHHLARHGSNEAVSLSLKQHCPGSIADYMFQV